MYGVTKDFSQIFTWNGRPLLKISATVTFKNFGKFLKLTKNISKENLPPLQNAKTIKLNHQKIIQLHYNKVEYFSLPSFGLWMK